MNAAKAASRMRWRTAVSSPASLSLSLPRFDIDALAINPPWQGWYSIVPPGLACPAGKKFRSHETSARFLHPIGVWYPVVPVQDPNSREGSKGAEPNED